MNVNEIYVLMQDILAKNIQQGYLSPDDFNTYINQAQRSYLDYLLGEYQQYQAKRPIPVVSFAQNERVRTSIAPLIYNRILAIDSVTGIAPFPNDFEQVDAMWGLYGFYNIRFTQQDRLQSNYRSVIDPVAENPIYLIKHEGFQFFPETTGSSRLSYVRTPPEIEWAYTLDSNNLPVYDPVNSSQPVWADPDIYNIIVRALAMTGVQLQLGVVMNYSENIKRGGQ